jgi:23S rRNA pseudouridine1911/1915/1917 synthase
MSKVRKFTAEESGQRLDQFLVARLEGISRARVQLLIAQEKVAVDVTVETKASRKLRAGERVVVTGEAVPAPLRAHAEAIELDVVYEDADLAVVNKPSGMVVHAGAGANDRGTLVNALLHHFGELSGTGGDLRPGIVHRLDKLTSGLMVVAKNDAAHLKLAEGFRARTTRKQYIALVHGRMKTDKGTVSAAIARDTVRRKRMTTRRNEGRAAVSHWTVRERLTTEWGEFSLLDVRIETGRTHQIRVHLSSVGHPVVGDTLYGAPAEIKKLDARVKSGGGAMGPAKRRGKAAAGAVKKVSAKAGGAKGMGDRMREAAAARAARSEDKDESSLTLDRNFLHAAELGFAHPKTGKAMEFEAELPRELQTWLEQLRGSAL